MNYIVAFAIVAMSTVMAALSGYPDYHWLIVSDINVAIALFITWAFDGNRSATAYTVRVKTGELNQVDAAPAA